MFYCQYIFLDTGTIKYLYVEQITVIVLALMISYMKIS